MANENITLLGYYNRHTPSDNYDEHLFRAGNVLQSAELNEVQSNTFGRIKSIADSLFKDGDIVRDARISVNQDTGSVTCESGAIYLKGAVRGVPSAVLTIPTTGTVAVGIILTETVVTDVEDPDLLDPARETRGYQEKGAARLKVEPSWAFQTAPTPSSNFFPVYYVENGVQRAKEAPPQLDSVTQAIARYDRDSAGSNYIVTGLQVQQLADSGGNQVYNVQAGRARVNGFGLDMNNSVRVTYAAVPDLRSIDSEPRVSSTASAQRVNLDRTPIGTISQVRITKETTETVTHGTFVGAQDPLTNSSVTSIVEVKQGGTTYVQGTDYKLTSGKVDWSLTGAEPATGSTYTVKYQHIITVAPTAVDDTGFTVTGAVVGSLILTNYTVKLPRIDRLCLNEEGELTWIRGVSTDYNPVRPKVPSNLIALAQVVQTWDANRRVVNDGVRTVPMADIEGMFTKMDLLTDLIAQQKLRGDIKERSSAAQKGLFVDPFLDDAQRDQGLTQTAAIVDGILTLPVTATPLNPSISLTSPAACSYNLVSVLDQTARTSSMKINPYMAFDVLPAGVQLSPAFDRWTEVQTTWTSPVTRQFTTVGTTGTTSSTQNVLTKSTTSEIENLRQIYVQFKLVGFGPNETLSSVTFDGLSVTPLAI